MEQVEIRTSVNKKNVESLLNQVYQICQSDPNLSPRPKDELEKAYKAGRLLIAVDESSVIGWLLRIPYTQRFQELASGYVIESYRSKGVFEKLLQEAFKYAPVSSIVTFNYSFAHYLLKKIGFKKSSLWDAIKFSNGKFLLNRFRFKRLKAIGKHYQTNSPLYTIYE